MIIRTLSTADIRKCFLAGANALDARKEIINDLNVFPVPDGDTGTQYDYDDYVSGAGSSCTGGRCRHAAAL